MFCTLLGAGVWSCASARLPAEMLYLCGASLRCAHAGPAHTIIATTSAVHSRCRVGTGCNRRRLLLLDFIACSPVSVPVWLQPPCTGVAEPEPADAPVGEIPTLPVSSAPTPTVRLLADRKSTRLNSSH